MHIAAYMHSPDMFTGTYYETFQSLLKIKAAGESVNKHPIENNQYEIDYLKIEECNVSGTLINFEFVEFDL